LAAYERQDAALAALTPLTSQSSCAHLLDRATPARAGRALRGAPVFALTLVLLLALCGRAVAASGSALPGEALYPVKLGVEALQRALTMDAVKRTEFDVRSEQRRVNEARALMERGRSQEMTISGELVSIDGGEWTVSGLQVAVSETLRAAGQPEPGTRVRMRIEISAGRAWAHSVDVVGVDGGRDVPVGAVETGTPERSRSLPAATEAVPANEPRVGTPGAATGSPAAGGPMAPNDTVTPGPDGPSRGTSATPSQSGTGATVAPGPGQAQHGPSGDGAGQGEGH